MENHASSHRLAPAGAGWHLEFRDPLDVLATFAGTHATLTMAMTEADR
jgi:hypothetical protein